MSARSDGTKGHMLTAHGLVSLCRMQLGHVRGGSALTRWPLAFTGLPHVDTHWFVLCCSYWNWV